jgi:hypothetical protein
MLENFAQKMDIENPVEENENIWIKSLFQRHFYTSSSWSQKQKRSSCDYDYLLTKIKSLSENDQSVLKRISEAVYYEPKSQDWLNKRKVITAANVSNALRPDLVHEFMLEKVKGGWEASDFGKRAMNHGNEKEVEIYKITCEELCEVGFSFGLLFHPKYPFLAMTPDIILLEESTSAELKAPYNRDVLKKVENEHFVQLLHEINLGGTDPLKYRLITNLTETQLGLLDKYIAYWHQMQLQMEILQFDTNYCYFAQYGTTPNQFYMNSNLVTLSKIKKDETWISNNIERLKQVWEEIENQRKITKPWSQTPTRKPKVFPLGDGTQFDFN